MMHNASKEELTELLIELEKLSPYTLDQYQDNATKHSVYEGEGLWYYALGICGEGGEFADKIKKMHREERKLTDEFKLELAKELGDVLWYLSQAAKAMGYKFSEIAEINDKKLEDRRARKVQFGDGDNR